MTIDIAWIDRGMIRAVLDNVRELDRVEMAACGSDLERLPDIIMRHLVFGYCAYDYELGPIAVWGMIKVRPGVGAGFAFGTEHWRQALLPMLHQIRGFVLPFLLNNGWHRVEAVALAHRRDVARFMALIGAEAEGVMRGFGSGGEDFISYRWLADDYRNERVARSQADQHAVH